MKFTSPVLLGLYLLGVPNCHAQDSIRKDFICQTVRTVTALHSKGEGHAEKHSRLFHLWVDTTNGTGAYPGLLIREDRPGLLRVFDDKFVLSDPTNNFLGSFGTESAQLDRWTGIFSEVDNEGDGFNYEFGSCVISAQRLF